jgi:hypothetical protein
MGKNFRKMKEKWKKKTAGLGFPLNLRGVRVLLNKKRASTPEALSGNWTWVRPSWCSYREARTFRL